MRIIFGLSVMATLGCVAMWGVATNMTPIVWIAGAQCFGMMFMMHVPSLKQQWKREFDKAEREQQERMQRQSTEQHWEQQQAQPKSGIPLPVKAAGAFALGKAIGKSNLTG